jgi:hypothetical protein
MATSNQYFDLVQTGKSSWVAVHIEPQADSKKETQISASEQTQPNGNAVKQDAIFADSAVSSVTFSERFPRLTITMIALVMFAATLTTEIDVLKGAGFFWQ